AVLPGSRFGEIRWSLDGFGAAVALLRKRHPDLAVVVPTVAPVAEQVREAALAWPAIVVDTVAERHAAMAAADAAMAASGTATVDLAIAGVPTVACYRTSRLTAAVYRRIRRTPFVTIVNLV